ncbi:MAG: hypothetical protein B6I34_06290 [Anaerolineaceae bacterium 4572_32.1]|nr:MAG: hypothetical protein B6I34_06290 [Anaerolineaceae bacterium 4572_32.1]
MLIIPSRRRGALVGGLLFFVTLLLDSFWLWQITNWPITFLTFVQSVLFILSLPWLALLSYWLYALLTLRYQLDRNRLLIRQGATWQVIPLPEIEKVELGLQLTSPLRYRGAWWPGCRIGHGEVLDAGPTLFYATTPASQQVILVTATHAYAISPPEPQTFLREFELRRSMGPTHKVERSSHRPAFANWAFWSDRTALTLLTLGGVTTAILFGRLCRRYSSLPPRLALHFNTRGLVDRIGQRSELFTLPVIGLIVLATNSLLGFLLYRREKAGAYLVWGSTLAVHILLWLALGQLMG